MLAMLPLLFLGCGGQRSDDGPRRLELFFLGHASKHHDSELLAGILAQEYFPEGINITYSTDPEDLTRKDLQRYDGLRSEESRVGKEGVSTCRSRRSPTH